MRRTALVCFALVTVTTAAALAARPAWPVDETRYLGVAWGMWARGDFLVPRLEGALYTDKPPLLFWLMHAGWAVFGVNAWWPRLLGPLAALLNLWLTVRLARRLFPGAAPGAARHAASATSASSTASAAELAPLLLCGSLLFATWSMFLMFDMLLVSATLLALLGLLGARQDGGARGWLLCGLGLGIGFLIKGPVLLVHVLPAALAVRWWSPAAGAATRGGAFALRCTLALLLGVALALLWVIPAGIAGGPEYRDALLFGQAAQRLANSAEVPHAEPWWFYLAMLPLMLLPWSLWPRLWAAVKSAASTTRGAPGSVNGVRFALAWALPALVLLSLIGSKQEQYLLPELPAFALLGAALLAGRPAGAAPRRGEAALPALLLVAAGVAMVFAALQWPPLQRPEFAGTSATAGLALAACGLLLACARFADVTTAVSALAGSCAAVLVAIHLGAPPARLAERDLRPAATAVATLQQQGRPIAYLGKYRAQYDFFGRLQAPIDSVTMAAVPAWFAGHADGVLVSTREALDTEHPEFALRALATLPSGELLWELASPDTASHAPGAAPDGQPPVRSPGPR